MNKEPALESHQTGKYILVKTIKLSPRPSRISSYQDKEGTIYFRDPHLQDEALFLLHNFT